jgi:hypothetical protein
MRVTNIERYITQHEEVRRSFLIYLLTSSTSYAHQIVSTSRGTSEPSKGVSLGVCILQRRTVFYSTERFAALSRIGLRSGLRNAINLARFRDTFLSALTFRQSLLHNQPNVSVPSLVIPVQRDRRFGHQHSSR